MAISIQPLDETNFSETIKGKVAVIDFFAEWCGPCKIMGKTLEAAAKELQASVILGKVDIGAAPGLAAQFNVTSIPSIVILKDGIQVHFHAGTMEKAELLALISKYTA